MEAENAAMRMPAQGQGRWGVTLTGQSTDGPPQSPGRNLSSPWLSLWPPDLRGNKSVAWRPPFGGK